MKTDEEFAVALAKFVAGAQQIIDDHRKEMSWGRTAEDILSQSPGGRKFIRIVQDDGHKVFCFVERATGNVLKAETFRKPETKHARGNIYDDSNGLKFIKWTGPMYMEEIQKAGGA